MNLAQTEFFIFAVRLRVWFTYIAMLKNWFHIIIILILLEIAIILSFLRLSLLISFNLRVEIIFLFSTLIVTEASVRMALLVKISRTHGNDYLIIF